jgi:hypothetical protein
VACLQYLVGVDHIFCVVVDDEGRREVFQLARFAEIYRLIESLTASLKSAPLGGSDRGLESFSHDWGARLLPPIGVLERFDVLVVIPHYCLHQLPLHVVRVRERGEFLGTMFGLVYNTSTTMFRHCVNRNAARLSDLSQWRFSLDERGRPRGAPAAPRRCAGIGVDVVGNLTPDYRKLANDFASHFAEPKTQFEIVKVRMPGERRAPFTAFGPAQPVDISPTRLIKMGLGPEDWEAVCLVCHGYHDDRRSQGSGLLLEKAELGVWRPIKLHRGEFVLDFRDKPFQEVPSHIRTRCEAEILTQAELSVECQTNAQLVALYGCHTAAGEISSAQAFNSVAYQWLKTGAASIIANAWEVDIELLSRLNPLFLKHWLVYRQPKAIALREAARRLLAEDSALPLARWGTIALFGDWL